jgi:hypothetical protein
VLGNIGGSEATVTINKHRSRSPPARVDRNRRGPRCSIYRRANTSIP